MRFSISRGGKFRVRTRRVSWSNRGGARVRVSRHVSVGKTGPRVSGGVGSLRASTGATGTRAAIVFNAGPFSAGVNSSGTFVTAHVGSNVRFSKAMTAAGQRKALASGMAIRPSQLHPDLAAERGSNWKADDPAERARRATALGIATIPTPGVKPIVQAPVPAPKVVPPTAAEQRAARLADARRKLTGWA